jgi:hypothetical protein
VSQTAQTWAIVAATVGAAFLGAIVGYIGSALQRRRQDEHDAQIRREETAREARIRLEQNVAELLAAAQDLVIGIQAIRQAHQRRTLPRYYLRTIAGLFLAVPELTSLRVFGELETIKSLTRTALELDRDQMDVTRMITLDTATVVAAKGNRYLAVAALLTLGQDKEITAAVRALTSKVYRVHGGNRDPETRVRAP